MENIILVVQAFFALVVTGLILVQTKGKGFGRSWGGSTSFTRRGLEKLVFKATFVFSAIFIVISIAAYVI